MQKLTERIDDLKQRIAAWGKWIRRYTERSTRFNQHRLFQSDQKRLYKSLERPIVSGTGPAPNQADMVAFWRSLWSEPVNHNEGPWTEVVASQCASITPMNPVIITPDDVAEAVRRAPNWKSPGLDGLHHYWLKGFMSDQKRLYKSLERPMVSGTGPVPNQADTVAFWRSLWSEPVNHNEGPWTEVVASQCAGITPMDPVTITPDDVAEAVRRTPNWKSPGLEGLHHYWLKGFVSDQKRLYKSLERPMVSGTGPVPNQADTVAFWRSLWSEPVNHNEGPWTEVVASQCAGITPMDPVTITPDDVAEAVRRAPNWKSPGLDGLHHYWLKGFVSDQKRLYKSLERPMVSGTGPVPNQADTVAFWRSLWSEPVNHNEGPWTEVVASQCAGITPMDPVTITPDDVAEAVRRAPNWKSPGLDGLHHYWLKGFVRFPDALV
ncbi:unnamed protein product [Parnassius apollo]|uniref:(apollo) hypothetical protein n=1 Tax=Parnassius apollo TaxID=110799 RepID=A0A8S3XWG4_PARAO|nr:unnamed protein product [Parnassius apollo]